MQLLFFWWASNQFLSRCDKVFINDGVESIINSFFLKENIKVQKNFLTNVDEIEAALKLVQENIERYIIFCCTQTPITIRDMISTTTEKYIPPGFDISTMSVNKFAISFKEQEYVSDLVFQTYCYMIEKLKSMIIHCINDLMLDIPNILGHLNSTFFDDKIFCPAINYTHDKFLVDVVVEIATQRTSQSNEFKTNFISLISATIDKKKDFFLFRV
ncbi:hypothetical protein COBT_003266, partial [Conglomerata obtusa]